MEPITIREFQYSQDYSQVIGVWEKMEKGIRLGASDTPKEIEKKLLRDPELFLVAVFNGELIGAVIGGFDGKRGYIYHLSVVAMFRGQGVASRLMEELESRLRAKGCIRCHLLVTNDNDEAKGFYLNHGWKSLDNVPFAKDLI